MKNETKLRFFQIRVNLKSIVINVHLHGLEIANSDCCVFCMEEPETIIHLFSNCKFVNFILANRHDLFRFEESNVFSIIDKCL